MKYSVCVLSHFSRVQLFVTLWAVAPQAPLSVEFSRQEHWSGLPFPPPVDLPNPEIKPMSLMSPALAGRFFTSSTTWKAHNEILLSDKKQWATDTCKHKNKPEKHILSKRDQT